MNSSETFDYRWRGGPRANLEIIERMNAIALYECLRSFQEGLKPTFRTPRGYVVHQLDHIYPTKLLLNSLDWCGVGSVVRVFDAVPTLSDLLPIIAEFSVAD